MTTCILHLNLACHYLAVKPTFEYLASGEQLRGSRCQLRSARGHTGLAHPAIKSALSRRAPRLGTKVGSELKSAVWQVPDFAAQAGSPSSRVTDTPMVAAFNQ
jgi:hypothetical protein